MVRVHNLRLELPHRVGGLLRRHRVRQVHADKRRVDVLQRAHLRDVLRVAAHVHPFAAEGHHVAVAASLVVKPQPRCRQVVHRHRLDLHAEFLHQLAVGQSGDALFQPLRRERGHRLGRDDDRLVLHDRLEGVLVEMGAVDVGHQHEVRHAVRLERRRTADRVDEHRLAVPLEHHRAVPDRMHLQVALGRLNLVGGLGLECTGQGHPKNESSHCFHVEKVQLNPAA